MKLNLDFYQEKEEKVTSKEQEIISKYIEKCDNNDYEKEIPDEMTDKEIYYLSSTSQNILNWYPFKKESTVLEIGGDLGQLTQVFISKCKEVTTIEPNLIKAKTISKRYEKIENLEIIVGDFKQIQFNKKFDYIVFIGGIGRVKEIMGQDMKLTKIIKTLAPYLKEDGKFLIAVDNKFGLRYFAGNPDNILNEKFKSMIGYNDEPEKIETFTKSRLERKFKEIGYCVNFYYPLPDYKMPNVIFSDKQLPKYNSIDKYNSYVTEKSDIIMNEIDVFREILKNDENMFPFFANSFLLEVSKNEIPIQYKYISFNNIRREDYRLITKVAEEYVEKQVVNKQANHHYENIKRNMKQLKEQGIKTVDDEVDGKIQSKYINQDLLLDNVITKALEENKQEIAEKIVEQYIEQLKDNTYIEDDYQKTIFGKYQIEVENPNIIRELHFRKNGLWDMTFKNCFYIEGELYFFDQEWNAQNLPVEYILYRSILYTISLRRFINIEDWFEKYNLVKFKKIFEELDNKLQEEIRDDKMWKFYSQNKKIDIDATKQEMINLSIRSKAQQAAMENLQKEKEQIQREKEQIQKEYEAYQTEIEKRITSKIYRKIKRITGGKYE